MSESFIAYRKAMEWFEQGRGIRKQLEEEEVGLLSKEMKWNEERMEWNKKIYALKHQITNNYGRKSLLESHNKTIALYKGKIASEDEMMKMEYATKCLEFIRQVLVEDAERQLARIVYNSSSDKKSSSPPEPKGLCECEVGDNLSNSINKLATYLEGTGPDVEDNVPPEAIYVCGPGKFIKISHHDNTVVEHNFPSIFSLKREGLNPDDVIGLAHMQIIARMRDDDEMIEFEWVGETKDCNGRYVQGYYGVSCPPKYFLENEHFKDRKDWRCHIPSEEPAKMYIGDYSCFANVTSMEDILEDGRLYDNRFGLTYKSTPEKVYWEFDWE